MGMKPKGNEDHMGQVLMLSLGSLELYHGIGIVLSYIVWIRYNGIKYIHI